MPATRITSDLITGGNAFTFFTQGEAVIVETGATLASDGAKAIDGNGVSDAVVQIFGSVQGYGTAVYMNGAAAQVHVAASGSIIAVRDNGADCVWLAGSGMLNNAGQVISPFGFAVSTNGGGGLVRNSGLIDGGGGGVVLYGEADTLINTGTIRTGLVSSSVQHGVSVLATDCVIVNDGRIEAVRLGAAGISVQDNYQLFEEGGNRASIENSGSVVAERHWAIDLSTLAAGDGVDIDNFGLIRGGAGGILGSQNADDVVNAGQIRGAVELGGGNDSYRGSGGSVRGIVAGGTGDDWLAGGDGADDFNGGVGDDLLRGQGGDDTLAGGSGVDRLVGGRGDDELSGGAGGDAFVLRRGHGDDIVADFQDNLDRLDLRALGFASVAELRGRARATTDGTQIDLVDHGGGTLLLDGFDLADLSARDLLL